MTPATWLGWLLAIPVVAFFVAALSVGLWLRYLAWRRRRELKRSISALQTMVARGAPRYELDRAQEAVERASQAGERYRAACRRFGVEP